MERQSAHSVNSALFTARYMQGIGSPCSCLKMTSKKDLSAIGRKVSIAWNVTISTLEAKSQSCLHVPKLPCMDEEWTQWRRLDWLFQTLVPDCSWLSSTVSTHPTYTDR